MPIVIYQVYQIYMYDLKELFNVESSQVASRIINSFLPGWHSPILLRPDVYGPLLAVFMLPQVFLIDSSNSLFAFIERGPFFSRCCCRWRLVRWGATRPRSWAMRWLSACVSGLDCPPYIGDCDVK